MAGFGKSVHIYGSPKSEQQTIENRHSFRSNQPFMCNPTYHFEDISFALDHHKQTDIILLDFSKAFDTVPHQLMSTIQTKILWNYW